MTGNENRRQFFSRVRSVGNKVACKHRLAIVTSDQDRRFLAVSKIQKFTTFQEH